MGGSQLQVGFDISALDPNFKEHAQRGIGRYVRELKRYFDEHPSSGQMKVGYFDHTQFKAGRVVDKLIQCAPLGRETLRQQIVYPLNLRSGSRRGFDVLHFPAQMDAPSWSPMPYLVTVLDLIPVVCRDLYQVGLGSWRFRLARWLELRSIQNASRVLVISKNTGKDVHELLGVPWERISVTPLGVHRSFFEIPGADSIKELQARYQIPTDQPTLLYIGGIDQRKNWSYMFAVLAKLRERCRDAGTRPPMLIIAGRITQDRQYPLFKKAIASNSVADLVLEIGYVADEDLVTLFHACSCFFFPSLYEGFGLPPLEALATGMNVISSNTSAMPEVLGSCVHYIDPGNINHGAQIAYEALYHYRHDPERAALCRNQAALFTWEKTGQETLNAYQAYQHTLVKGSHETELRVAP